MDGGDIYCACQAQRCAGWVLAFFENSSLDTNLIFLEKSGARRKADRRGRDQEKGRDQELKKLREPFAIQRERMLVASRLMDAAHFKGNHVHHLLTQFDLLIQVLGAGAESENLQEIHRYGAEVTRIAREIDRDAELIKTGRSPATAIPPDITTIRLLLLSDLHCGADENWLWPNVEAKFLDDLDSMQKEGGPIDLVIFSGDLGYSGKRNQFDELNHILGRVWPHLLALSDGTPPVLLTVPGNHDLARPGEGDRLQMDVVRAMIDRSGLVKQIFAAGDTDSRRVVNNSFAEYRKWQELNLEHQRGERKPGLGAEEYRNGFLPGDFSYTFTKGKWRLGVVGLNTAYRQLDAEKYEGRLLVDCRQLHKACGGHAPEWLKSHNACLLVTHHPVEWLDPNSRSNFYGEIYSPRNFCLHIHGHMHVPNFFQHSAHGISPKHHLQVPSLFGLEKYVKRDQQTETYVERTHGYCLLEVMLREECPQFRIRYRVLARHGDRFNDADDHIANLGSGGWSNFFPASPPKG